MLVEPKDKKKRVIAITELLRSLRTKDAGLVGEEYVPEVLYGMGLGMEQGDNPTKPEPIPDLPYVQEEAAKPHSLQSRHSDPDGSPQPIAKEPPVKLSSEVQPYEHADDIQVKTRTGAFRGAEEGKGDAQVVSGDVFGEEIEVGEGMAKDYEEPIVAAGPEPEEPHEEQPGRMDRVYTKSAFAIQPRTGGAVVWYHCCEDYQLNTTRVSLDMRPGFTFTSTPEGALVAGGKDANLQKASFWTQMDISTVANIPTKHCYHSATYWQDNVYLISGEVSSDLSAFNIKSRSWTVLSGLPGGEHRSRTGSCAWGDKLYLLGGMINGAAPTDQILEYGIRDRLWRQTKATLDVATADVGAKFIAADKILIFGGITSDTKVSSQLYVKELSSDSISDRGKLPEADSFREFSPSLEIDFLVFSASGKLFMLGPEKKEMVIVALPPVNQ